MSGTRDFNNIETRVFSPLQSKAAKEIDAILTEILACFLPGRAKDLSAPLTEQENANVRCSQKCFAVKHAADRDQRVHWTQTSECLRKHT